nr:YkgJ family cysteine cluster protein [uncultured Desulfobacter sp.]
MGKKHLKFVSISDAVKELQNTLIMQSEINKQKEIKPLMEGFWNFEIRKDSIKVHPLDFADRNGLWIKSDSNEQFYYGVDLVDIFIDLLNSKPSEIIAQIYSKIERVNAKVARHPKTDNIGILIETGMEKFKCIQCGHCCIDLPDAIETSVPDSDVLRWERENRYDILDWVVPFAGLNDIWIDPKTGEPVDRCPWLKKLPKKNIYICRIHETKPEHCRNFPKSKRHALDNDCKGFSAG